MQEAPSSGWTHQPVAYHTHQTHPTPELGKVPVENGSSPSSASNDRFVRWKTDNQSRYFRKHSAPEEWEEDEEDDGEDEGGAEGEEGGMASSESKAERVCPHFASIPSSFAPIFNWAVFKNPSSFVIAQLSKG
jgi:hypothetical protein